MLSCSLLGGAGMQCIHLFQAECQAGNPYCVALVKLMFLQWVCIAYSTVGSTGKVAGANLGLGISVLVLYILHLLALAGTLILVVASCCCWLAIYVQTLMHTW